MLRLHLLGPLELGRNEDDLGAVLAQPKRFALLAYLATGATGFQRRDTLLAVFWPELDQFAARRALRNTLYQLRRALGDDVFVTRGDDEVMIDRAKLWCDAWALREAVGERRYDEAIALYRGELMEGFHVSNVGEAFEAWLARERAQALDVTLRALGAIVEQHQRDGHHAAAARAAMRATELAPFDESWLRRAALALEASGDRAGALRACDAFARRLATELDVKPGAEIRAVVERLRAEGSAAVAASPPRPPHADATPRVLPNGSPGAISNAAPTAPIGAMASAPSSTTPNVPPRATPNAPSTAPPNATPVAPASTTPAAPPPMDGSPAALTPPSPPAGRRGPKAWRRSWLGMAALCLLALTAVAFWPRPRNATHERHRVLVTLFENRTGDPKLDPLSDMAVDWITRGLLQTRLVDVVDPRVLYARAHGTAPSNPEQLAHRNGAGTVITGSYYRSGDSLLFIANITNANGEVLRSIGPLAASISRPVDGIESTRSRVMTSLTLLFDPRTRAHASPATTPPPFEAYQPYLEAQDMFWLGHAARAESLDAVAWHRDTSFSAAAIALAAAAARLADCARVDSIDAALSASRSLETLDRLNLKIAVAHCHGRNDEMLRLAVERAHSVPVTSPLQVSTAGAALWANHPAVAVAILERLDPRVDLDWMPSPDLVDFYNDIDEGYHLLGRHDDELAQANHSGPFLHGMLERGRALAALGRSADALRTLDTAFTLPPEDDLSGGMAPNMDGRTQYAGSAAWVGLWLARELAVHGDSLAARTAAARTVSWLDNLPLAEHRAPEVRLFKAELLEQTGALADAEDLARGLVRDDPAEIDYRGILAGLAAARGDTALVDQLDAWLAAVPPSRASWGASYYRARAAARLGRQDRAVALVRETLAAGAWPMWLHIDPLLHPLTNRPDYIALTKPRG